MNLAEVLMAAMLLAMSAGSSLRIWSLISVSVIQEERRQQLADRLDGELAALEASLRLQNRQGSSPPPCGNSAAALQMQLNSRPSAAGVQRQLKLLPAEDGLLLELAIDGLPFRRQRLVLPAAMGLCRSVPTTRAAPGLAHHG